MIVFTTQDASPLINLLNNYNYLKIMLLCTISNISSLENRNHTLTARPFSKAFLEATKCSRSRVVSTNCNNTSSDYGFIIIYTMLLLSKFCYYQVDNFSFHGNKIFCKMQILSVHNWSHRILCVSES